jgi:hypothetical protein
VGLCRAAARRRGTPSRSMPSAFARAGLFRIGEFGGQAEIAWQNNNGAVGLWLMNGTTPAAEVGLSNPGAGWQLVSVDRFTPNGQPDLLFQNTNGAMMLWEMTGTSVAAMVNLPNPGAG